MNDYVYQRALRAYARGNGMRHPDHVSMEEFNADCRRAKAARRKRLDYFNVTDSRITSVAMRERIRTGRQS